MAIFLGGKSSSTRQNDTWSMFPILLAGPLLIHWRGKQLLNTTGRRCQLQPWGLPPSAAWKLYNQNQQTSKAYLLRVTSDRSDFLLNTSSPKSITFLSVCLFFLGPVKVCAPPRVKYTKTIWKTSRFIWATHVSSLLIFTQWAPTWQHQHKRERIWQWKRTVRGFQSKMKDIKCLYALLCAGVLWPSVDTHCALSLSISFFLSFYFRPFPSSRRRPFRSSVNHKWPRLPTNPALHKNQIRLLSPRKCPVTMATCPCVQGGVWEFFFFFLFRDYF